MKLIFKSNKDGGGGNGKSEQTSGKERMETGKKWKRVKEFEWDTEGEEKRAERVDNLGKTFLVSLLILTFVPISFHF